MKDYETLTVKEMEDILGIGKGEPVPLTASDAASLDDWSEFYEETLREFFRTTLDET